MKFRPKEGFGPKDKRLLAISALIMLFVSSYLLGAFYLLYHIPYESTMKYEIDSSKFMEAEYSDMREFADLFNMYYQNNHTPLDYTLTVYWNSSNYKKIDHFGTAGDAAIWSGMNLAAQSFHYAAARKAEDEQETEYAIELVKKALKGVSILIAVPSGGVGEGYPAILSRSVCPKNWTELGNPLIDSFTDEKVLDEDDVFDGAGQYSDWWWKGYPSTDQWSGIILGLGQCARMFKNEQGGTIDWIKERVRVLAIQIIESFIKSNWMLLDLNRYGDSRTTGQDFKMSLEMSGIWVLSILKMGMLAAPDRYTELYYHYAYERNYINGIEMDYRMFNLHNYYSLNINFNMLTNLVSLEEDPALRTRYENIVNKIYYPIIRISRNAWFNMAFLYMMHNNERETYSADEKLIVKDIEDQLMRFNKTRSPRNTTRIPERGGDRNIPPYKLYNPTDKYRKNPLIASLYGWVLNLYDKEILEYAKRTDEYHAVDFCWQRTTWEESPESPYTRQDSGLAFLLVYYIGRYLDLFPQGD